MKTSTKMNHNKYPNKKYIYKNNPRTPRIHWARINIVMLKIEL